MTDREPDPRNPLSPSYPSAVPGRPGTGRKWAAILLSTLLLFGAVYAFATIFFAL